jgi:glycine cleavage system H protein
MVLVASHNYPEDRYYDVQNQVWYAALPDGTLRAGFTPLSIDLAGQVLAFTPKRVGKEFEPQRSLATVECGKWVGAARAAFAGVVIAVNEALVANPRLLNDDALGAGWMVVVRPLRDDWSDCLVTAGAIGPAFDAWIAAKAYKDRSE